MTKRNRAQRREAWANATPEAIEADFQRALHDRYRESTHTPDVWGRRGASPREIDSAMRQRGSIEKG